MNDEQFKELVKALRIEGKKEDHKIIDKNLSLDELKKLAGQIMFSMTQEED